MTGIFANDTYNNGVTRDNFAQYAHTYHNPRDPYNNFSEPEPEEGAPKIAPTKFKKYNNDKNNNKKSTLAGVLFVLAIIIFVIIFTVKMFFVSEEISYYDNKVTEAQQRLDQLGGGGETNFIIPSLVLGNGDNN